MKIHASWRQNCRSALDRARGIGHYALVTTVSAGVERESTDASVFKGPRVLGVCLVVGAVMQLIGAFPHYMTFRIPADAQSRLPVRAFSSSEWSGMHWERSTFLLFFAVIAVIGLLLALRPSLWHAGFACGASIGAVVSVAYLSEFAIWTPLGVRLDIGWYLTWVGVCVQLTTAVVVGLVLLSRAQSPAPSPYVGFAVVTGLIAAVTTLFNATPIHGLPVALYSPLTLRTGLAALVGFVVVGALPTVAMFVRSTAGVGLLLGFLTVTSISLVSDVLVRYGSPVAGRYISVAFWVTVISAVLLAALARLCSSRSPVLVVGA